MVTHQKGRAAQKITPRSLDSAALAYLRRYATSATNLHKVLMRRVQRATYAHEEDLSNGAALVDALVSRYLKSGLLDDRAYAQGRTASLHRRGLSRRGIASRLAAKGVASEVIDEVLLQLHNAYDEVDFDAACNYARRRRLGPWRSKERAERRRRDLAALIRQGFSYELVVRVIDAADITALEAKLRGD